MNHLDKQQRGKTGFCRKIIVISLLFIESPDFLLSGVGRSACKVESGMTKGGKKLPVLPEKIGQLSLPLESSNDF